MFLRSTSRGHNDAFVRKEILVSNLASSWVYEKLVTNVRLSDKTTDTTMVRFNIHTRPHHYFPTGTKFMQPGRHLYYPLCAASSLRALLQFLPAIVVQ